MLLIQITMTNSSINPFLQFSWAMLKHKKAISYLILTLRGFLLAEMFYFIKISSLSPLPLILLLCFFLHPNLWLLIQIFFILPHKFHPLLPHHKFHLLHYQRYNLLLLYYHNNHLLQIFSLTLLYLLLSHLLRHLLNLIPYQIFNLLQQVTLVFLPLQFLPQRQHLLEVLLESQSLQDGQRILFVILNLVFPLLHFFLMIIYPFLLNLIFYLLLPSLNLILILRQLKILYGLRTWKRNLRPWNQIVHEK